MNRKLFIAAALVLLVAATATAQMPPGKWWRQPGIIQNLQLTTDQQDKLESIFTASAPDLIDLRADVEKAEVALRAELDRPDLNRQNILKAAARVNEAQGKKFARELGMLVDMRTVLSETQWNKMRNQMDRMGDRPRGQGMRNQGQPRPEARPGMQRRQGPGPGQPNPQPQNPPPADEEP